MTMAGVSTTTERSRQQSAYSPATMRDSDGSRVASETSMGVVELMNAGETYL